MPKITFIDHQNNEQFVDGLIGDTLMETAVKNNVTGIDADCGGACACATCHVYFNPEQFEQVGPAEDMEQSMLDFAEEVGPTSRLSCQIKLTDALDGLRVTIPEVQ